MKYFKTEKGYWFHLCATALVIVVLLLLNSFLNWDFATFLLVLIVAFGLLYFLPIRRQIKMVKENHNNS